LFTPSKTSKIEETPLNLSVFSSFTTEHSLVDKYNFQGKIIGYFLTENLNSLCLTYGGKHKFQWWKSWNK